MADDGHVILDAQGRRIMRDDGSLDICQKCCVDPCAYCSGSTPGQLIVVFSDIELLPECCQYAVYRDHSITSSPTISPNGTFILQQNSQCSYRYNTDLSGNVEVHHQDYFPHELCTDFMYNFTLDHFIISVKLFSNKIVIEAYYTTDTTNSYQDSTRYIFYKSISKSQNPFDCLTEINENNYIDAFCDRDNEIYSPEIYKAIGINGSVSITPD